MWLGRWDCGRRAALRAPREQLFVRRRQLAASALPEAPEFVPVVVTEDRATVAEMAGRIEIALGPAVVRIGADVDAAALRRVLEVVRGLA